MVKRATVPTGKALFFRPTEAAAPAEAEEEKSPTRQSAIFLEERHIDWLEDRCRDARRRGGRAIRKAAIIRALLDVAMESPIDLGGLRHEEDLVERVRRGLQGS